MRWTQQEEGCSCCLTPKDMLSFFAVAEQFRPSFGIATSRGPCFHHRDEFYFLLEPISAPNIFTSYSTRGRK